MVRGGCRVLGRCHGGGETPARAVQSDLGRRASTADDLCDFRGVELFPRRQLQDLAVFGWECGEHLGDAEPLNDRLDRIVLASLRFARVRRRANSHCKLSPSRTLRTGHDVASHPVKPRACCALRDLLQAPPCDQERLGHDVAGGIDIHPAPCESRQLAEVELEESFEAIALGARRLVVGHTLKCPATTRRLPVPSGSRPRVARRGQR